MPNDERILETMPTGTLGLIPTAKKASRQPRTASPLF